MWPNLSSGINTDQPDLDITRELCLFAFERPPVLGTWPVGRDFYSGSLFANRVCAEELIPFLG